MEHLIGIQFLTTLEVVELHDEAIELTGGDEGIDNFNLIDSAVNQPKQQFDRQFLYESIHLMAATYLFGIACNHGFRDGNKRTAARAVFAFYFLNGYLFEPPEDELVDFVVGVTLHKPTRQDIADFLEKYVTALPVEDR